MLRSIASQRIASKPIASKQIASKRIAWRRAPWAAALGLAAWGVAGFAPCRAALDFNAADSALNAPNETDSGFVVQAAQLGWTAATRSALAARVSSRSDVQQVAAAIARDERRTGLLLGSLQRQKAWTLPPPRSAWHAGDPRAYSDAGYIAGEIEACRSAIGLYEAEAAGGEDSSARALARRILPVLRQERTAVEALR